MNTRKRYLLASLLTGILCATSALTWWGANHLPLNAQNDTNRLTLEEKSTQPATALDDYAFEDLKGNVVALNQYRGRAILLNFWATWCPPCVKELPDLDALAKKFESEGLVIIAASQDKDNAKLDAFLQKHPTANLVIVKDSKKMFYSHKLSGLPTTILFNRKGEEVERIESYQHWLSEPLLAKTRGLLKQ